MSLAIEEYPHFSHRFSIDVSIYIIGSLLFVNIQKDQRKIPSWSRENNNSIRIDFVYINAERNKFCKHNTGVFVMLVNSEFKKTMKLRNFVPRTIVKL